MAKNEKMKKPLKPDRCLLPGEAYPGQRKKLKKRDEQIYKERISDGTTYRELGIRHGGLSKERVRQIIAKQARIEKKIEYMKKPLKERLEDQMLQRKQKEKIYLEVQNIFGKSIVP